MTRVYFVRHAQSDADWKGEDRTRPLTREGWGDTLSVTEVLGRVPVDAFYSSPYQRSVDTIRQAALDRGLPIQTEEQFRERENGKDGLAPGMIERRWEDFDFHEPGGESLNQVQQRNLEALMELLVKRKNQNLVIGTHGTALAVMLNFFDPSYQCADFLRIMRWTPYMIRLDFDGFRVAGREEMLIVDKGFSK